MKDAMIDIETFGVRPGSQILSVAAVEFNIHDFPDPKSEYENTFYRNIIPDDPRFAKDPSTMDWWEKQSVEARAFLYSPDPIAIEQALIDLDMWFEEIKDGEGLRVWARGPSFDMPMLSEAYAIASKRGKTPWYYNQERDVRTLIETTNAVFSDGYAELYKFEQERFNGRTKHYALHDCFADLEMVQMCRHLLNAEFD